jgi:predicted transcriptional regulator
MTLQEIAAAVDLRSLTPELEASAEVTSGHASDLLSDVLANAPGGGVLLTIQVHLNVVAVALHAAQAAVIFTSGMLPEEAVRAKAVEERLPLYATGQATFDLAGRLYALGIRGRHE